MEQPLDVRRRQVMLAHEVLAVVVAAGGAHHAVNAVLSREVGVLCEAGEVAGCW